MVMTTSLYGHELNQRTRDIDLNELLDEVIDKTGENWQVIEYYSVKERWFRKPKEFVWYSLCVEVGGFPEYQIISCVYTARECKAYLMGVLTGLQTKEFGGKDV